MSNLKDLFTYSRSVPPSSTPNDSPVGDGKSNFITRMKNDISTEKDNPKKVGLRGSALPGNTKDGFPDERTGKLKPGEESAVTNKFSKKLVTPKSETTYPDASSTKLKPDEESAVTKKYVKRDSEPVGDIDFSKKTILNDYSGRKLILDNNTKTISEGFKKIFEAIKESKVDNPEQVISAVNDILKGSHYNGTLNAPAWVSPTQVRAYNEGLGIIWSALTSSPDSIKRTALYEAYIGALKGSSAAGDAVGGGILGSAVSSAINGAISGLANASGVADALRMPPKMAEYKSKESFGGIFDAQSESDAPRIILSSGVTGRDNLGIENTRLTARSKLKYSANKGTIEEYLKELDSKGLLTGYKDYAGFEIGSDHDWVIQIFPYPHDIEDKEKFSDKGLGRVSRTPELPCYIVPNFWPTMVNNSADKSFGQTMAEAGINALSSFVGLETGIDDYQLNTTRYNIDDQYRTQYANSTKGGGDIRFVDFSEYCPVISYDLSYGNPKTESYELFNGSSFDTILGFQYNMMLNLSILDDLYGSMRKYFNYYYNQIYDLKNNAIAPYYAIAFDIRLYIFRSGKQIKDALKLIGIPMDYSPRLSGDSEPNESRVDVTFSIIGADKFTENDTLASEISHTSAVAADLVDVGGTTYKSIDDKDRNAHENPYKTLKWNDVLLNPNG